MSFLAHLLGASRFVKPQPGEAQFLYSWSVGDASTEFTRASTADYVDAAGVVRTAAVDTPRVSLDATGEVGLLIEPAQTFAWSRTADYSSAAGVWSQSFLLDPTTDGKLGPDGVTPAQKLIPSTAFVNSHRLQRATPDATDDTAQTLIADLLDAGYHYVVITPLTRDGAAYASTLDAATGTVVQQSTQHEIHVLPLANGFYRFWLTANSKHGTRALEWRVEISDGPVPGQGFSGDGTKGVYCSLLQVAVDGDYATSPMSATSTAPTRSAESWTVTGAVSAHLGERGTLYEKYVDLSTAALVERVTPVVSLTADFAFTTGRSYRAVKIALGSRTLAEMQGDASLPPTPVATTITITPTVAALSAGQTIQTSAVVRDQDGNLMAGETVTYASSDTDVATVTSAGAVTAVAEGGATITATSGSLTATLSLTVSAVAEGAGFQYDAYPHSTTGLLFRYTDFRTSYLPDTPDGDLQKATELQFLAEHVDKAVSGGEPDGGYPVGFVHQPYILTSFIAANVHDNANWDDGRAKTEKRFLAWCGDNGADPEDGYLHWTTGSTPYGATITSIDDAGKVTLKYDFTTYAEALSDGDTVVIAGCTPVSLNGTWTISDPQAVGGGLDDNGDLTQAQTIFFIPHTGDVAITKGTASLPVRSEKTKRNRLIFDIAGYPPPRWCINHAHPTRIAFEQYRLAQMLTGAYGISYTPEGFYIDEIVESNINRVAGKLCREYAAGSTDQFYTDMATFYKALSDPYRASQPWIQELGTASYTHDVTVTLIDAGPKCAHLEQLGNTHIRFEWVPNAPLFEWVRSRLRNGAYLDFATPYFATDTIDGGQKPGNYADDPVPAGIKAAANVRMYASLFCVALLMQFADKPGTLCVKVGDTPWNPSDPTAGLNNRWLGLFEVDLGAPTEDAARVVTGQTDTAGQGALVAARHYERGLVVYRRIDVDWAINTVDYAATYAYTPPASSGANGLWSRVRSDGTLDVPSDTFNLASDEGLILVPSDAPPETPAGTTYHVTTSGTSLGDGSTGSPWSLTYALGGAGSAIQPGDTVEVAAGTYTGDFTSTLAGTVASPITVKAAAGARATIDGTLVCAQAGQYTWFWGLEVMRSVVDANIIGVNSFGTGNRFIHCVIHDHPSNGLGMWSEGPGQEAYGNLIYNNGYSGQDPTHSAHGIYTQNLDGFKNIKHNVIFDQYGYGIHAYGSELVHVDGYTIAENVLVNNGRGNAVSQSGGMNFLVENGNPIVGMEFTGNLGYYTAAAADTAGKMGSIFEPSVANDGAAVTDNYMVGLFDVGFWQNMTFTGNTCIQQEDFNVVAKFLYADQPPVGGTWDDNEYYSVGTGNQFQTVTSAGVSDGRTFADWKTTLSVDAASAFTAALPTANKVVVQPSDYETGRANIVIFNWESASTVDVDVSGVLTVGDDYELLDVNDFYGTAVATGTVAGGSITITLAEKTPPASVSAIGTMPSTGTAFKAYVIRKTS